MAYSRRTDEEKREICEYAVEHSNGKAAKHYGVSAGSISNWCKKFGISFDVAQVEKAAVTRRARALDERGKLMLRLAAEANRQLDVMWQPSIEKKAMTVSDGHLNGAHVEIVEIEHDVAPSGDQKTRASTVGTLIDKMHDCLDPTKVVMRGHGIRVDDEEGGGAAEEPMTPERAEELLGEDVISIAKARARKSVGLDADEKAE